MTKTKCGKTFAGKKCSMPHGHDWHDDGRGTAWEVQGAPKITPAAPAEPAALALPTVEEVRTVIVRALAKSEKFCECAAQAVLDLIAARVPVWQPVEPGTVIKAGTLTRVEWADRDAREEVARSDYTPCPTDPARFYIDPRTVPAEPEDPKVGVVIEWLDEVWALHTDAKEARELLARLDAVEG